MADTVTTAKVCIACGQDCAGKPRTKDSQGRYMCKPCFGKAQAKVAPVAAAPEPEIDSGVLALLEGESAAVRTAPCPSCGAGLASGSVICTTCGHDLRTGKGVRSVVQKEKGQGAEKAKAVAGAMAAVPGVPIVLGGIGAAVGAGIGAAIWAVVCYQTGYEVGWIAWGVGVLAGFGMLAGVRSNTSVATGALAAGVSLIGVGAGKYLTVSAMVDHGLKKASVMRQIVTDERATAMLARDVATEYERAHKKLEWPGDVQPERPSSKAEFPANVWSEAAKRWSNMTPQEQGDFKHDLEERVKAVLATKQEELKKQLFSASFGAIDLLWAFLAVGSAFRIGAGVVSDSQD